MKRSGVALLALSCSLAQMAVPAHAQRIDGKAKERARWYNAPHEVQIIDDRPMIKDFREAPEAPQYIELPPPPPGTAGMRTGGAGALSNSAALPRADYGHQSSNIGRPIALNLPSGTSSGGNAARAEAARAEMATRARLRQSAQPSLARPVASAPSVPVYSYNPGSNYGTGGTTGARGGASADVVGRLLTKIR